MFISRQRGKRHRSNAGIGRQHPTTKLQQAGNPFQDTLAGYPVTYLNQPAITVIGHIHAKMTLASITHQAHDLAWFARL